MQINSINNTYGQIASGNRLTSAAVSPSDLAISNKMTSQETGLNQGANNIKDGISALNISDGALAGITENLQRVHELSLKASNGLLTSGDKDAIQSEIDGLLKGIDEIANGTEFNTKKLLNGDGNLSIASNPDGSGQQISTVNSTVEALGLKDFNITGNFDINKVTDALSKVTSQRSGIGAQTNALESAYRQNTNTVENVVASKSKIADLDMPKAISEQKKAQLLQTMQFQIQRKKMEDEHNNMLGLFQKI